MYGSWWGNNPKEKREEEIDLVLANEDEILVGECKCHNEKVGLDVIELLKKRGELVQKNRAIRYAVFSKSGFTDECKDVCDIILITAEEVATIAVNSKK